MRDQARSSLPSLKTTSRELTLSNLGPDQKLELSGGLMLNVFVQQLDLVALLA